MCSAERDRRQSNTEQPLLRVKNLRQYFSSNRLDFSLKLKIQIGRSKRVARAGRIRAVDRVSFDLHRGETLGIVGETGCGKTTLARSLIRIYKPDGGKILFDGDDVAALPERKLGNLRRRMQMVFQDPMQSMNPRHTIGYIIEEPLLIQQSEIPAAERCQRAMQLLDSVGLSADHYHRFPHEFSGGQRQRIAVARALIVNPQLLLCDEPVSALDVSVQSQIINLIIEQQQQRELTMLFISHDLSVVRHVSDRVAVMYLGKIVEIGSSDQLYSHPRHPYTRALIAAIPDTDRVNSDVRILRGDIPSPINPPPGCRFHTRCPHATAICREEKPQPQPVDTEHTVSCHRLGEI